MPQGDKSAYTRKQQRQARHIEEGYLDRGLSEKEAERRAWSTVNARSGGGKQSGSGRKRSGRSETGSRSSSGTSRGGSSLRASSGQRTHAQRSAAAKKGWATRRRNGNA